MNVVRVLPTAISTDRYRSCRLVKRTNDRRMSLELYDHKRMIITEPLGTSKSSNLEDICRDLTEIAHGVPID